MFLCICLCVLVTSAITKDDADAILTNYTYTDEGNGAYSFQLKTNNSIERNETSRIIEKNGKQFRVVEGAYKHIGPDGNLYKVAYKANDKGFYHTSRLIVKVGLRIGGHTLASLSGSK